MIPLPSASVAFKAAGIVTFSLTPGAAISKTLGSGGTMTAPLHPFAAGWIPQMSTPFLDAQSAKKLLAGDVDTEER